MGFLQEYRVYSKMKWRIFEKDGWAVARHGLIARFMNSLLCWTGLANFTGSICRKYNIELAGVMQYVANQLKAGKR